jgi:formylglycine-generating enzyme required for sulfatase activity
MSVRTFERVELVRLLSLLASVTVAGCGAEVRPQLFVVVDTDAPLFAHVQENEAISRAAQVDTLRIDVHDDSWSGPEPRVFLAVDPRDWPVTFGATAPAAGAKIKLRLRLWRGTFSHDEELMGQRVSRPWDGVAIDRLVELTVPDDGVTEVGVLLSLSCMGARASFGDTDSCVSAEVGRAPATTIDDVSATSRVGTAALARESPCQGAPAGAICIPGGFSLIGDERITGFDSVSRDAVPMRPVAVSPFAMDVFEVTVGELRQAWPLAGVEEPAKPTAGTATAHCTWLGADDDTNDAMALSCVSTRTAAAFCASRGGALPTEAQWEHAARGRGLGSDYPWGNATPSCCIASHGRFSPKPGAPPFCGQEESPEPPGSHPPSVGCDGLGDLSRDGVADLGGGLSELVRDAAVDYDASCWRYPNGVPRDPVCDAPEAARIQRGGRWNAGPAFMLAATRREAYSGAGIGFRCVYEVAP